MDHLKASNKESFNISEKMSMAERLEKWRESKASTISATSRLISPPPSNTPTTSSTGSGSASKFDKKLGLDQHVHVFKQKDHVTSPHSVHGESQQSSPHNHVKRERTANITSPAHKHLKDVHHMYDDENKHTPYEQNIHPNMNNNISISPRHHQESTSSYLASTRRPTMMTYPSKHISTSPKSNIFDMSRLTNGLLSPSAHSGYSPDPSLISSVRSSSDKISNPQQLEDMEIFMRKYLELKKLYNLSTVEVSHMKAQHLETSNRLNMASEEVSSLHFLNAVQEMRIGELESCVSTDHIKYHESSANRNKKHKAEVVKMKQERMDYEERANSMIQQMAEQMTALQSMAMTRIEVLEKELLESRRKCDKLEEDNMLLLASLSSQHQDIDTVTYHDVDDDDVNDDDMFDGMATLSRTTETPTRTKRHNRRQSSMFRNTSTLSSSSSSLLSPTSSEDMDWQGNNGDNDDDAGNDDDVQQHVVEYDEVDEDMNDEQENSYFAEDEDDNEE